MSDIIQLLPDSVANQIAAGEVIQRPASVVKELVENSVDADAHTIDVLLKDAGRTSIQVIDDGIGMTDTDARLSFERHATSKIRHADDLFNLHTMGFRGEALASIAAVAQVTLTTRRRGEEIGTQVNISGSRFQGQEPVSCAEGTNFVVENLFYNVPARRKFLKSNTTELNNVLATFERIVLSYPDIAFSLHNNGTPLMQLSATNLHQRIIDVFGKKMRSDLLPVEMETNVCRMYGFVGTPFSARKKGAQQFFFVNGRFMRHPYFHKAVQTPYERLVAQGEQVPYFLYFEVPAGDIDVNIHPTKTEIKFENEQVIWQLLCAAVKNVIGQYNDIPSINFDVEGRPDIPALQGGSQMPSLMPKTGSNTSYNPFDVDRKVNHQTDTIYKKGEVYENWQALFPEKNQAQTDDAGTDTDFFSVTPESNELMAEKSPHHYQYKGRYIMTAVKSGLMIIDQHRAHLRILYEQYRERMQKRQWHTQQLLFPEMIQLPPSESVVLDSLLEHLSDWGFDVSSLGGGSFAIAGVPSGVENVAAEQLLRNIISEVSAPTIGAHDDLTHHAAMSMARASAMPYGQLLTDEEMDHLVNSLFACSDVNVTPDGRHILGILGQTEIEHLLG